MKKESEALKLITLKEAAEYSGFSYNYLRNLVNKGRLKAHKRGVQWFTTREAVDEYIASRQRRGRYRNDISI
jgi:excisionase family DNA binding protein